MLALIRHYEQFQSTLSMRRATYCGKLHGLTELISIHALHEESDQGDLWVHCIDS